ncbi:MAG: PilZ domain-containing protein [Acidobacteriaceae bacterium]
MHRFLYRYPRVQVDLSGRFEAANETLPCRCIDMSIAGAKVELAASLAVGAQGMLTIYHQARAIELNVRVAHASKTHSGLEFLVDDDEVRSAVADLIESSTVNSNRSMFVLPPPRHALHTHRYR